MPDQPISRQYSIEFKADFLTKKKTFLALLKVYILFVLDSSL